MKIHLSGFLIESRVWNFKIDEFKQKNKSINYRNLKIKFNQLHDFQQTNKIEMKNKQKKYANKQIIDIFF